LDIFLLQVCRGIENCRENGFNGVGAAHVRVVIIVLHHVPQIDHIPFPAPVIGTVPCRMANGFNEFLKLLFIGFVAFL
jgi:hypothetical protein